MDGEFSKFAVWALMAVAAFLGQRIWKLGDDLKDFKLDAEKTYQRKDSIKQDIRDAVQAAFDPVKERLSHVVDELDSQRRDINILLDKFEVPAAQRHGH